MQIGFGGLWRGGFQSCGAIWLTRHFFPNCICISIYISPPPWPPAPPPPSPPKPPVLCYNITPPPLQSLPAFIGLRRLLYFYTLGRNFLDFEAFPGPLRD